VCKLDLTLGGEISRNSPFFFLLMVVEMKFYPQTQAHGEAFEEKGGSLPGFVMS
jgi:hypothetical protein